MSQIELKEEQIKGLEDQYFSTKSYIEDLLKTKKSPRYKQGTDTQRNQLDMQLNFLLGSQNKLIETLIDHGTGNIELLRAAKKDKHLKLKTRLLARKYLNSKPILTLF